LIASSKESWKKKDSPKGADTSVLWSVGGDEFPFSLGQNITYLWYILAYYPNLGYLARVRQLIASSENSANFQEFVKRRRVVVNSPYRVPKEVVPLGEPPGVVCQQR
jgi:hypothetical protein